MAEEHTQQPTTRGKGRRERVEYARSRDILDVASELSMELVRSGRDYRWKEHDSMVISPDKNMWNWFSRHQGGDVISLVETMKEVNFNQAIDYLNDGSFKEYTAVERVQEPFSYYLDPYEQPFDAARTYLKEQRGLSDETIDFFLDKGVLAQANAKVNGSIEPVVVFKSFDFSGEIVGATLQGIEENWEKWPERGYAKNIVRNSDGITGLHVDIGQPNRLIFAESTIDLMSYYELHKDTLQDIRLVSMDGVKEAVIGRHLVQLQSELSGRPLRWSHEELAEGLQTAIDNNFFADGKHADWITLAVDNDEAGRTFVDSLREKGATINEDLPDLQPGQDKTDWNDALKNPPVDIERDSEMLQETLTSQLKTYDDVKKENDDLVKRLENRIKEGDLAISFDTDVYLYDVFAKLGNSHPFKYLNAKRLEILSPLQPMLVAIDEKTVDLYKNKGTMEQDALYQALAPHQRTLGVDISTRFIGELAIAAYSTNKQLDSLSMEHFGAYYGKRTLDTLSQSIERILEYPLNETGTKDYTYSFVTTPNAFYHYLEEQEGEVVLSRSVLDVLLSRLEKRPLQVVEQKQEEVRSEQNEKAPDRGQELSISEQQKNERTNGSLGSLQPDAEGSPTPVPEVGTFERSVTSRPTLSSHLLYFTINEEFQSSNDGRYHAITPNDLVKLNRTIRRQTIQNAAQYYLDELANSKFYYVTPNKTVQVNFEEKHFMHLTGIKPIAKGQTPEKTLHDFASGNGSFDNILLANNDAAFDKINVISDLSVATESTSFYFDDLTDINRYNGRFDSLIKSDDKDILLLFKELGDENYIPISVFQSRTKLVKELETIDKIPILGVYRERDGQIEQLSINEEFVKDGGQEMVSILKNKQYEESRDIDDQSMNVSSYSFNHTDILSAELFTQVLDSAYNVGDPRKLGLQVPEESKGAWKRYYELSDSHEGNFSAVVDAADQLGIVDKNSNFYQEWNQDRIHNEDYHVRLQWAERWPDGPQIPFKETELVGYQTFAETLYKENKAFYARHHGSMAEVNATGNQEVYIPFTKVKFDVYAPGGTLIKSDIRYDIGDETEPISRLLGLGYRRLEGQPELAAIDEMVLSHLENQEVNQDIATEANEHTVVSQEILESTSSEDFQSPKQGIRTGLAQRVEEIMAEDATKILVSSIPQIQENLSMEGDLIGTPQSDGQVLYTNQEDFGRDYQLELAVHSPVQIDQLSDIQAPWTLALIQGEQKLGYLAYGGDWGNDFQVKKDLEKLASQIGSGNSPEGLYKQEEIDAFLTNNEGQEPSQRTQENISSAEPFDYESASAYEISERAFQKIRKYTQSPEDLMEYMEFMSKFPQLSPRNVALIQDQWRGANAVATYDQWQSMGEALGIKPEDVIQTKATYVNKRTGETKEVVHQGLSVKTGEKSQITLFRPLMVRMIPVIDENGNHVKNDKGNPKYKKFSDATPQEKELVKAGKLPVRQFQERDPKAGQPRFTTYKVFELSQTTLKAESYPKAMPNRHYNFDVNKVKTKEVLEGLCDYAESIGVSIMKDEAHVLGNAKGAFFPEEQLILINPDNTPGEKIATTIHELAHATLHNPSLSDQYKELPKVQKELEAEMTSHLLSKHFGLDTSEKAIDYMAKWTDNLQGLDDKQLADSLKRIHKTVSKMHKQIEHHTKPYQLGKSRGQTPNFPKAPTKGPSR
ncbi:PBECR4 domain-containing protein [Streptococcus dysgalactiae]|uniref:PBECR4 domain-containing protein n=1 Tax=Streptococcus dysgalactiae TaxID=1334 RepID=UPI0039F58BCB